MRLLIILIGLFTLTATSTNRMTTSDSYDISNIYEMEKLESGTKVIDSRGDITEAKTLLLPAKMNTGKYDVELTRLDSDYYQVCGKDIIIQTRYCHEYANRDEAILIIKSNYGYTKGEVIFLD